MQWRFGFSIWEWAEKIDTYYFLPSLADGRSYFTNHAFISIIKQNDHHVL